MCSGSSPRNLQKLRQMKVIEDVRFIKDANGTEDMSTPMRLSFLKFGCFRLLSTSQRARKRSIWKDRRFPKEYSR
ncbi:hypothetical protein TIFTF001_012284 [Ficus carica]|uniref:Uncharacterized protein n=1 Tax=Ficus carica TaxID=3494 RepID=A0AA88D646_FICCA|nr:hypothetical protein TIFTF001_012284 [Ficus carica]